MKSQNATKCVNFHQNFVHDSKISWERRSHAPQENPTLALDKAKSISLAQEKGRRYVAMIQKPQNKLKNKRDLYNYLLKFGDIYDFRYDDNSKVDRKINTRKNILVSYMTEGGLRRACKGRHRDLEMIKPSMPEDEEVLQGQRSIQQDHGCGQRNLELMADRSQDQWDPRRGCWKDRKYEELMRIRSSQKAVTNRTNDDIEDEGNNSENRSICNPPHKIHIDAICPIAKGMFGKTQNWN